MEVKNIISKEEIVMILHELDDLLLRIPGITGQDDLPVFQGRHQKLDHLGERLDPGLLGWFTPFVPALIKPLPAWHPHPEPHGIGM